MADTNMIWIAANRSGNSVSAQRRVTFALLATVLAKKNYNIDTERVYLSGFSGGGRIASEIAPAYPQLFNGAIYHCGVNFWNEAPTNLELVRNNRFVFITGSEDFNRRETRRIFGAYQKAGVDKVTLIDVTHMGHSLSAVADLRQAV